MKKQEVHKPVHKETIHKDHVIHHTHDKKKKFLMIGIAILVVLIIGIIVATIVLTKPKADTTEIVPVTSIVDTNSVVISTTDTNMTLDDFKAKYEQILLMNNQLNAKIQPEFTIELEIAQTPVFETITTKLNLNKEQIKRFIYKDFFNS